MFNVKKKYDYIRKYGVLKQQTKKIQIKQISQGLNSSNFKAVYTNAIW